MPLTFNTILQAHDIDPIDVRLLRHQARGPNGETPYSLWRDDRPQFEAYQAVQTARSSARLNAKYWASFVVTPDGRTLLADLYQVLGSRPAGLTTPHILDTQEPASDDNIYELEPVSQFAGLAGRLYIAWGAGVKSWIQRADLQDKPVEEISHNFAEPPFPGFSGFIEPLSRISTLPAAWAQALAAAKGVYLLTCPTTKEVYVGSAIGGDGFLGRWREYAATGHGGNVRLKQRDPSDYQVSILEVAGSLDSDAEIYDLERRWKRKLQSREMGLNAN